MDKYLWFHVSKRYFSGFVDSAFCSGLLKILKWHRLLRETSSSLHKFHSSGRGTALYTSPYLGLGGLRVDGIGLRPLMALSLSGPRKPVCTLTQRGYVCLGTVSRLDALFGHCAFVRSRNSSPVKYFLVFSLSHLSYSPLDLWGKAKLKWAE